MQSVSVHSVLLLISKRKERVFAFVAYSVCYQGSQKILPFDFLTLVICFVIFYYREALKIRVVRGFMAFLVLYVTKKLLI
ncbi:hypothetical protein [Helicobacter trogontum]|uniref:hypothetical protein n=1 Tax=Helicobacter trogontum TaxID=50960 RepID=UPI000CF130CB|nr:hypothetical protein [Helicobacter trogontum]